MEEEKLEISEDFKKCLETEGIPLLNTEAELVEAKMILEKLKKMSSELKVKLEKINYYGFIKANENTICLHLHGLGITGLLAMILQKNPIMPISCIIVVCCIMIMINLLQFKMNLKGIKKMINPGDILSVMEKAIQDAEKKFGKNVNVVPANK